MKPPGSSDQPDKPGKYYGSSEAAASEPVSVPDTSAKTELKFEGKIEAQTNEDEKEVEISFDPRFRSALWNVYHPGPTGQEELREHVQNHLDHLAQTYSDSGGEGGVLVSDLQALTSKTLKKATMPEHSIAEMIRGQCNAWWSAAPSARPHEMIFGKAEEQYIVLSLASLRAAFDNTIPTTPALSEDEGSEDAGSDVE